MGRAVAVKNMILYGFQTNLPFIFAKKLVVGNACHENLVVGLSKSQQLGREDVRYTQPEKEDLEAFAAILTANGVPVKLYGSMV